jgi:hypothetical protein
MVPATCGSTPPVCGWAAVVPRVALTYTAALAAQHHDRPDRIRAPKRILAHLWEGPMVRKCPRAR